MLKYRKETNTESISEPVSITLEKALAELDSFPTDDKDEGSFLDFIYDDRDIQLIRFGLDSWYVDIPVVENGEFVKSFNIEVDTKTIKNVLIKFAQGQNPNILFDNLSTTYHKQLDDEMVVPREQRSYAIRNEYLKDIVCICQSTNFDVTRTSKECIKLKCILCSKVYSLNIDISDDKDNNEPVITFLPIE